MTPIAAAALVASEDCLARGWGEGRGERSGEHVSSESAEIEAKAKDGTVDSAPTAASAGAAHKVAPGG